MIFVFKNSINRKLCEDTSFLFDSVSVPEKIKSEIIIDITFSVEIIHFVYFTKGVIKRNVIPTKM